MNYFKKEWLYSSPTSRNAFFLIFFSLFICGISFFFPGEINLFKYGLYLPGVDAVLRGVIPYRDFFHFSGPVDLYIPAFLMKMFEINISMLSLYFSVGAFLTLVLSILIVKHLYKTQLAYILFILVLSGKMFLNVHGDFSYVFGLSAIYCTIKFFQQQKKIWIFSGGILTSVGFLTGFDVGMYCFVGIVLSLFFQGLYLKNIQKGLNLYVKGVLIVIIFYSLYLVSSGSLFAFTDSLRSVFIAEMQLQYLTPLKEWLIIFVFFYLLERFYFFYLTGQERGILKKRAVLILLYFFVGSSLGFMASCYYKRFSNGLDVRALQIRRAKGVMVPISQARELESLAMIMQKFISKKDKVFMYPDGGALYFLMERPFYGRFPMAGFSCLNDKWHQELIGALENDPPKYVILPKVFDVQYDQVYFLNENNRKRFNEVMWFVAKYYDRKATTLKSGIYALKKSYIKRIK